MNDQERFAALRERLSRQMRIKELGEDGEKRILKTRFLVIGAGGLGSPALLYLASSGASHITVVDPDEVSENNLSRQILHDGPSIGLNKAQNAARELLRWNPVLDIRAVPHRMADVEELRTLVREHDIVLDCSDNLATRQLANRACFIEKKPLVFAAAVKLSGQVTVLTFVIQTLPAIDVSLKKMTQQMTKRPRRLGSSRGSLALSDCCRLLKR